MAIGQVAPLDSRNKQSKDTLTGARPSIPVDTLHSPSGCLKVALTLALACILVAACSWITRDGTVAGSEPVATFIAPAPIVQASKASDSSMVDVLESHASPTSAPAAADPQYDADQRELLAFLRDNGFAEYATREWILKLDDVMDIDGVGELEELVDDLQESADDRKDWNKLGLDMAVATKLQAAARKYLMRKFLGEVPLPKGLAPGYFEDMLEPLLAFGYDQVDDIADIDAEDASEVGIEETHLAVLTKYGSEYGIRQELKDVLQTYASHSGSSEENPFAAKNVSKAVVDELVAGGVEKLADVWSFYPRGAASSERLRLLKLDRRVRDAAAKHDHEL